MPSRKKRQTTPKGTPRADRFTVAARMLVCAFYALKIGEWFWTHWQS